MQNDAAVVSLHFQHATHAMRVHGIPQATATCAPGAKVVTHRTVFKFDGDVACAFTFHPWRAQVGAHVCAFNGHAHPQEHLVDVVAAVGEELAATQTFGLA